MKQLRLISFALICGLLLIQTQISFGQNCGGFITITQDGWSSQCVASNPGRDNNPGKGHDSLTVNNAGCYLKKNFQNAFPNYLFIGCSDGFQLKLISAQNVINFLPASGAPNALDKTYTNPISTFAGELAGQLVTLTLNIGFDNYDINFAPSNNKLKDQYIHIAGSPFRGKTVEYFLNVANQVVGGCSTAYSIEVINETAKRINENYINGTTNDLDLVCLQQAEELEFVVEEVVRGKFANVHESESSSAITSTPSLSSYPNPFTDNTSIELNINYDSPVTMEVYNFAGELVSTLFKGNVIANEKRIVKFEGSNLNEGAYYCKVSTSQGSLFSKLIFVK